MVVSAVLNFRPRDGRLGEQLENLKAVKRLVERAGGTFRVHRQLFGAQANTLVAVSEYKDWNGFAKLRSDSEFLQLVDRIRSSANPAADNSWRRAVRRALDLQHLVNRQRLSASSNLARLLGGSDEATSRSTTEARCRGETREVRIAHTEDRRQRIHYHREGETGLRPNHSGVCQRD